MKYIKINTLYKRDEKTHKIIINDFSKPEFDAIRLWDISEKVDGSNTRIMYENDNVTSPVDIKIRFDGRDNNSQMNTNLFSYLQKTFTVDAFKKAFMTVHDIEGHEIETYPLKVILYGEGYGAKIQKGGGLYRKDVSFVLFDVWVDNWWLQRKDVKDIADKLGIKSVPEIGIMSIDEAVDFIKLRPNSLISEEPKLMEGIVARSHPLMLFRDCTPIMWKLKVKDYDELIKSSAVW